MNILLGMKILCMVFWVITKLGPPPPRWDSNTLFQTIILHFACRPLGTLVRFPCVCGGGGGTAVAMQV